METVESIHRCYPGLSYCQLELRSPPKTRGKAYVESADLHIARHLSGTNPQLCVIASNFCKLPSPSRHVGCKG
jgi:hypothetical protein